MASHDLLAGRFLVEEMIHEGPMTSVFRALDRTSRNDVAIKLFKRGKDATRIDEESFLRETLSLRVIDHPHVVKIIDQGNADDGRLFIALEWAGAPLNKSERSFQGDWTGFFRDIGKPILSGLNAAHIAGVKHRDVKPSNILIDKQGVARLADFNIASLASHLNPGMTFATYGTAPYAAPDADNDGRGYSRDCYAFAAVTVSALNGQSLRSRQDIDAGLTHLRGPREIQAILARALSTDALARHGCAAELLADLESAERALRKLDESGLAPALCVVFANRALELAQQVAMDLGLAVGEFLREEFSNVSAVLVAPPKPENAARGIAEEPAYNFWCQRARFLVKIDRPSGSRLRVIGVDKPFPHRFIEAARIGWVPQLRFEPQQSEHASGSADVVRAFEDGLAAWLASTGQNRTSPHGMIIENLKQIIQRREQLLEESADNIEFEAYQVLDDDFAEFQIKSADAPLSVDDVLMFGDRNTVQLSVYDINESVVTVRRERGTLRDIPRSGILHLDISLAKVGLRREQKALQVVAERRGAQTHLRDLLEDPSRLIPPALSDPLPAAHLGDEYQQRAVCAAICCPEGTVINGPPGTGKTKVIGAIIQEFLSRNPKHKVLLASQTHVAVDNAIDELVAFEPGKVIRLGDPDDPGIDAETQRFLIGNVLGGWLAQIAKRGSEGVAAFAVRRGTTLAEAELRKCLEESIEAKEALALRENPPRESPDETQMAANERPQLSPAEREALKAAKERARLARQGVQAALQACGIDHKLPDAMQRAKDLVGQDSVKDVARILRIQRKMFARAADEPQLRDMLLSRARVVAATCNKSGELPLESRFDMGIVDEASKATITETLVPLSRSTRWVLIGDSKQLPPHLDEDLVESAADDKEIPIESSLIGLSMLGLVEGKTKPECLFPLVFQRRMAEPIGELVSQCFYDGKLQSARRDPGREDLVFTGGDGGSARVVWLSTSELPLADRREQKQGSQRPTYRNVCEAREIGRLLTSIADKVNQDVQTSFMCVAGYSAQVDCLRQEIAQCRRQGKFAKDRCHTSASTIDAIQGQEADVVIISVTRSNQEGNPGFLRSLERINVAMSRAKELLVIVGDDSWVATLQPSQPLRRVLNHILTHQNRGCTRVVVKR